MQKGGNAMRDKRVGFDLPLVAIQFVSFWRGDEVVTITPFPLSENNQLLCRF